MVDVQVATPCQIAAPTDANHSAYAKRVLVCRGLTLSCWRLRLGGKSAMSLVRFRMKVIHSVRFVLSQIRCRNICKKLCQINRILAIAGLASKRAWLAVNLSTLAGLVAASFAAPVGLTEADSHISSPGSAGQTEL